MESESKNGGMKMLLSAIAVMGAVALFSVEASADVACRVKGCGLPPPAVKFLPEEDFTDSMFRPADAGGTGLPTARHVDKVNTPGGAVNLDGKPEDRSQTGKDGVFVPGIYDITFAVSDGERVLTGAEALDMATGDDAHFSAGQFKEIAAGVYELCY